MKKAVVLGASGGMGYALAMELASRGFDVRAVARTKGKLEELYRGNQNVAVQSCDAFDLNQLKSAVRGADYIFQAINIPYHEWAAKQDALLENVFAVAKETEAKLVIVDNIYAYGRSNGRPVNEDSPKTPHTKKGKLRMRIGEMVRAGRYQGVMALNAHFPDFYGPNAESTLLQYTFEAMLKNKSAMFVGDQTVKREYIFTPDGAAALVDLALQDDAYGQSWNIPGAGVISGEEIVALAKRELGYTKKVGTVGKGMMAMAGIFNPLMREYMEMMYLTEEPVVLSGEKYEKHIGEIPKTPYEEGIKKTIQHLMKKRGLLTV